MRYKMSRTGVMNGMPLSGGIPKPLFCAEKFVHRNPSRVRRLFNARCVCAGNPGDISKERSSEKCTKTIN